MDEQLSRHLLFADTQDVSNPEFSAVSNAHGNYNTYQFTLRLSPKIYRELGSYSPGIKTSGELGFEFAQAMSTFLHETIHWWQHIGSTYGFILSLNYPMQSHCTYNDLNKLAEEDGFRKSVVEQAKALSFSEAKGFGTASGRANTIINNHYDLLTYRAFTLGPELAKAASEKSLFESVGHAFHMTVAHTVTILASTVDKEFKHLPHPKEWTDGFRLLT